MGVIYAGRHSLRREPLDGRVEVMLSVRSKKRIDEAIREHTPRNQGGSLSACILRLNAYVLGWVGFFGICTTAMERTFSNLDAHIRRRLRAIQLRHWKRKQTNDREEPHLARQQAQDGVVERARGSKVYLGAQPCEHGSSSTRELPLGGTWARLDREAVAPAARATRRPGAAHAVLG